MILIEDGRLGGQVRYVLSSGEDLMRIPEDMRKCVGFLGYLAQDGTERFSGTFFFTYIEMGDNYNCVYGVTARHVITGMQDAGIPGPMIRLNPQDDAKNASWIRTEYDQWVLSAPIDDLAIIRLPLGRDRFDYRALDMGATLTPERIQEMAIGPGTEVFIPGLFLMFDDPRRVYGVNRNVPIVRSGHIAAMTGESVPTAAGKMDAYLIEARSIGGLSGSPVFAHLGSVFVEGGQVKTARGADGKPRDHGIFWLMGVVHGHFPIIEGFEQDAALGVQERDVNMGIAIVIPVQRMAALLARAEVVAAREAEFAKWQERAVVTPDQPNGPEQPS
jgi:hypothetical protein